MTLFILHTITPKCIIIFCVTLMHCIFHGVQTITLTLENVHGSFWNCTTMWHTKYSTTGKTSLIFMMLWLKLLRNYCRGLTRTNKNYFPFFNTIFWVSVKLQRNLLYHKRKADKFNFLKTRSKQEQRQNIFLHFWQYLNLSKSTWISMKLYHKVSYPKWKMGLDLDHL